MLVLFENLPGYTQNFLYSLFEVEQRQMLFSLYVDLSTLRVLMAQKPKSLVLARLELL